MEKNKWCKKWWVWLIILICLFIVPVLLIQIIGECVKISDSMVKEL